MNKKYITPKILIRIIHVEMYAASGNTDGASLDISDTPIEYEYEILTKQRSVFDEEVSGTDVW